MARNSFVQRWKQYALPLAVLLAMAGVSGADDDTAELRRLVEEQGRQIEELKRQIQAQGAARSAAAAAPNAPAKPDDEAVKKIIADYLKDKPGAGMPSGVQTGYSWGQGFVIRSAPNPAYVNWEDECKIPFELRFRGRAMLAYQGYFVTDKVNHQTNVPSVQNANSSRLAERSIQRWRVLIGDTSP